MEEPPEPAWSDDEISRLADNSIKSLAHRLALWESGGDELTPSSYERALDRLRDAIDRQEISQDPTMRNRDAEA